ncbi:MAG TPA: hypothetical protein VFU22_29085, partial [Roseiflexaceae bacterium]|nr:hypothetical protein [Roseiflexaceae bacterium]
QSVKFARTLSFDVNQCKRKRELIARSTMRHLTASCLSWICFVAKPLDIRERFAPILRFNIERPRNYSLDQIEPGGVDMVRVGRERLARDL